MAAHGSRHKSGPVTRSLTTVYIKCRQEHNDKKRRFGFDSRADTGNQRLLRDDQDGNDEGIEMSHLPPQWVDIVDEANEDIQKIREKLAQLHKAQQKRLLKVFKDDDGPDKDIEIISSAIAGFFRRCEGRIHQIITRGNEHGDVGEKDLALRQNVQRSLATELQKLSQQFRKTQKQYLTDLRKRQAGAIWDEETGGKSSSMVDIGFNDSQMMELDNMEVQVGQRSEEIAKIASSISDLHTIFKELAVLVIDQGSILDRIDYNIEQVVHQSKEAHVQLQKAEKAQKSNRAMKCIMILVIANLILIGILILKHRH